MIFHSPVFYRRFFIPIDAVKTRSCQLTAAGLVIFIYFSLVSNLVTAICTRYGIKITGIARYARTL